MKISDFKKSQSNYNKKAQEEIFAQGFDDLITYFMNYEGGFLATHGKLDIFKSDEDFETALLYACAELRDTLNLENIFSDIVEESDECCENYTPEVYLSQLVDESSRKKNINESRTVFSEIGELASDGYFLLSEHCENCETDVIRLLHVLLLMHSEQLFNKIFKGKITKEGLVNLIKKFDEEDFDINIVGMMLESGMTKDLSHPMDDSMGEVIGAIVDIIKLELNLC